MTHGGSQATLEDRADQALRKYDRGDTSAALLVELERLASLLEKIAIRSPRQQKLLNRVRAAKEKLETLDRPGSVGPQFKAAKSPAVELDRQAREIAQQQARKMRERKRDGSGRGLGE